MQTISKTSHSVALIEKPIPAPLKGHVLIKVLLCALCRTDMFAAQNQIPMPLGMTLGHEFTGEVVQVADGVDKALLGLRVGVMPVFEDGSMLGIDKDGAYADYVVVPVNNVYPLPEHLTLEEAAFLEPIAASLAVLKADIHPSQRGLIFGNNRIAELTRRILVIKGFHHVDVLSESDAPSLRNCYDFVIETVPSESALGQIIQLVKPKGVVVLKSRPYHLVSLPFKTIVTKEIKLIGAYYGAFQEGIDLLASGALNVWDIFGQTYTFREAVRILAGEMKVSETNKLFFKP